MGRASILGIPINTLSGDTIRINNDFYTLSPETYNALSSTSYTGKSMKNENDILMMNRNKDELNYTGVDDKLSIRKTFLTITLPKLADDIQNTTFGEKVNNSDKLQEGLKFSIPSNIIDIYSRLEILLAVKLSSHTDTLTEASNLIDELYKRGEIQNEQQYRIALDKFLFQ